MPRPKPLTAASTLFPEAAVVAASGHRQVSGDDWTALANDLWQSITTAYSVRQPLEENLRQNLALYEMETTEKDFPYVDSSNIVVPIIPAKLDALLAQVVAKTLVPEFYIVSGNTEEAAQNAYKVTQYYNAEFRRQRKRATWFDEHIRWLHLALRDGTAFMEVLWKRQKRLSRFAVQAPVLDDDGMPSFKPDGKVHTQTEYQHQEVIDYDDVDMRAVWLKDVLIIPGESTNLEEAAAVARCLWLYESDLNEMVEEGLLDAEWVERALSYVPAGTSDVASDRQGHYDKDAGGQIDVGQGQGIFGSKFFANRGPLKVWRVHSRQYDMNGDRLPEENIFFVHEQSTFMLGWCPAEYLVPGRPLFGFCPFPRPDRPYGYAVPERLASIAAEMSKWHNDRNDAVDLKLSPPMLINRTEEIHDNDMQWGPGKTYAVADVLTAMKQVDIQDPPVATFQEETLLGSYADQLMGISQMMTGGQSSSRRSAAEAKITTASSGTRSDLIAMLFRVAARQVIEYAHKLKLQYPPDEASQQQTGRMYIDPQILAQDYKIDVAGTSDPLDADSHFESILGMYNLLSQDHDIASNAVRRYNLKKDLMQAARFQNIEAVLGSEDEAKQALQKEGQMAEEAHKLQTDMQKAQITEKNAKAHHEDASLKLDAQGQQFDQQQQVQQQAGDQQAQQLEAMGADPGGAAGGASPPSNASPK